MAKKVENISLFFHQVNFLNLENCSCQYCRIEGLMQMLAIKDLAYAENGKMIKVRLQGTIIFNFKDNV